MLKRYFAILSTFFISLLYVNVEAIQKNKCRWLSVSHPTTFLEFHDENASPYLKANLYHKNNLVMVLSFTQSQGYGTKWWGFNMDKLGGSTNGRVLQFKGNYPIRNSLSKGETDIKFMLVGLGSSLYYHREKLNGENIFTFRNNDGIELMSAAEGYFALGEGCSSRFMMR